MSLFKKSNKSRQLSRQPISLGIPTHVAVAALGISADLAPDIGPEGVFRPVTPELIGSISLSSLRRYKRRAVGF